MELFKAHAQWKTRPADERFKSVIEMHRACSEYRAIAKEASVPYSSLRVEAQGEEIALVGKTGIPATLTHWAMGQLSTKVGAPASYLRDLPPTLAAQNLNHGLKARTEGESDEQVNLLFHANGALKLRSAVSERYTRIWNSDITEKLLALQERNPNWKNPLAYKIVAPGKDGGWPTMSGGMEPSGLYASDHDMFAFLVDESKTIDGAPEGLNRGFFVWNSEVGASSFGIMTFLYNRVCGNNIVWGAQGVSELRVRHIGNADARAFGQLAVELRKYSDSSTSDITATIEKAKRYELGTDRATALTSLLDMVNRGRITDLPQAKLKEALEVAEGRAERYGNPYTIWGAVNGLTEASQWNAHADSRIKTDRAAGKLLKIAF